MKFDVKVKVLDCEFNGTVEADNYKDCSIKSAEIIINSIEILKVEPTSKDIVINSTYNFLCQK